MSSASREESPGSIDAIIRAMSPSLREERPGSIDAIIRVTREQLRCSHECIRVYEDHFFALVLITSQHEYTRDELIAAEFKVQDVVPVTVVVKVLQAPNDRLEETETVARLGGARALSLFIQGALEIPDAHL